MFSCSNPSYHIRLNSIVTPSSSIPDLLLWKEFSIPYSKLNLHICTSFLRGHLLLCVFYFNHFCACFTCLNSCFTVFIFHHQFSNSTASKSGFTATYLLITWLHFQWGIHGFFFFPKHFNNWKHLFCFWWKHHLWQEHHREANDI